MAKRAEETGLEGLPMEVRRGIARGVQMGYRQTYDECEGRGKEREALWAHLLLANIERCVDLNLLWMEGVEVAWELNCRKTALHLVVRFRQYLITVSAVERRTAMVRPAEFRKSYARRGQGELFPMDVTHAAPELFAVVLHGPPGIREEPGFIDIVPPTQDYAGYVEEHRLSLIGLGDAQVNPATDDAEVVSPAVAELKADVDTEEDES